MKSEVTDSTLSGQFRPGDDLNARAIELARELKLVLRRIDGAASAQDKSTKKGTTPLLPRIAGGRALDLLYVLARSGERITTYAELASVIDPLRPVERKLIRMLHVYVCKIREVLAEAGMRDAIISHANCGYSIGKRQLKQVRLFIGCSSPNRRAQVSRAASQPGIK